MLVKPEPQAVEDGDQAHRLDQHPRLLQDLLHRHLGRRVADVGPAGRVEPHARVGPLDQEYLAPVVADHRADGHLGGDVARRPRLPTWASHSSTRSAGDSATAPAAILMSAATRRTSSNRSRS